MSKFVMPITTAVLLFPLIAALITAPFLIYKYRKVGSVPWLHAAAMYSFVFYLMCAYFLVLLPLPADRTAVVAYAQTPRLSHSSSCARFWPKPPHASTIPPPGSPPSATRIYTRRFSMCCC